MSGCLQVANLEHLRHDRSVVDLVDSGSVDGAALGEGFDYLLMRPVGDQLQFGMRVPELVEVCGFAQSCYCACLSPKPCSM